MTVAQKLDCVLQAFALWVTVAQKLDCVLQAFALWVTVAQKLDCVLQAFALWVTRGSLLLLFDDASERGLHLAALFRVDGRRDNVIDCLFHHRPDVERE